MPRYQAKPSVMVPTSNEDLLRAAKWAAVQLTRLVTEDEGNGSFIRGTGVELVGFGIGMDALRKAIDEAEGR